MNLSSNNYLKHFNLFIQKAVKWIPNYLSSLDYFHFITNTHFFTTTNHQNKDKEVGELRLRKCIGVHSLIWYYKKALDYFITKRVLDGISSWFIHHNHLSQSFYSCWSTYENNKNKCSASMDPAEICKVNFQTYENT